MLEFSDNIHTQNNTSRFHLTLKRMQHIENELHASSFLSIEKLLSTVNHHHHHHHHLQQRCLLVYIFLMKFSNNKKKKIFFYLCKKKKKFDKNKAN